MPCTTSLVFLSTKTDIKLRKAGRQETIWKPGMRKKQQNLLISCFPDSLLPVFWLPDLLLFSLVNYQFISVGVAKLRHPANWRLHFLNVEADATLFQFPVSIIEIFHLERDGGAIA
jgi:hypothetical protein